MKVLVVDDDPVCRALAATVVEALGHAVTVATDGAQAWALLEDQDYDVVVTDREMPEVDGLELCTRLRARTASGQRTATDDSGGYCYVIVLTSHDGPEAAHEGITAGADDYLAKPLNGHELRLRLLSAQRVTDVHRDLRRRSAELAALGEAQHALARRDLLTELPNRLALQEHLERLDANLRRYGRGFSVALFDLDHFKAFNDAAGHGAGDTALRQVAQALLTRVRDTDGLYRFGGEEFVFVIETPSAAAAAAAVERLRAAVDELALPHPAQPGTHVTLSAGVATVEDGGDAGSRALLEAADAALYEAKDSGRNQTRSADLSDRPALPLAAQACAPVEDTDGGPVNAPEASLLDPEPLRRMQQLAQQIGRNLADEVVHTWRRQLPERLAALDGAVQSGRAEALQRAAHSLKGSSATVGATALAALCSTLERSSSWPERARLTREAAVLADATETALVDHLHALLQAAPA